MNITVDHKTYYVVDEWDLQQFLSVYGASIFSDLRIWNLRRWLLP